MAVLNIVFVLETNDDGKTDAIYLSTVLDKYYSLENIQYEAVNTQTLYMDGKQNYNKIKLKNRIKNLISMYKSYGNPTVVIYFFDTDSTEKTYKPGSFFYNVQEYCNENGYELVWFCKNAENVFLDKDPDSLPDKLGAAKEFDRNNKLNEINEYRLSKTAIEYGCSNILMVLDKYLRRKNDV